MAAKRVLPTQPLESSIDWRVLKPLSDTLTVANFFGLKEKTLRTWRSENSPLGPPYIRLGGRSIFYEKDGLRRWYDYPV